MSRTRQFWRQDDLEYIVCEWNEITGSWRCCSNHPTDHQYANRRLHPFVRKLQEEGFQELVPGR